MSNSNIIKGHGFTLYAAFNELTRKRNLLGAKDSLIFSKPIKRGGFYNGYAVIQFYKSIKA